MARARAVLEPLDWLQAEIPWFQQQRWVVYTITGENMVLHRTGTGEGSKEVPVYPWKYLSAYLDLEQHSGVGWHVGSGLRSGLRGSYCIRSGCLVVVEDAMDEAGQITHQARRIAEALGVYAEVNGDRKALHLFCETMISDLPLHEEALLREHRCELLQGDGVWCPITGVPAYDGVSKSTEPKWRRLFDQLRALSKSAPVEPGIDTGDLQPAIATHSPAPSREAVTNEEVGKNLEHQLAGTDAEVGVDMVNPSTDHGSEPSKALQPATCAAVDAAARSLEDHWVMVNLRYVQITGSANAGIMLAHAVNYLSNAKAGYADEVGWIHCDHVQWEQQTALSQQNQRTARQKLVHSGTWEENGRQGKAFRFRLIRSNLPTSGKGFVSYHPCLARKLQSTHAALIIRHGAYLSERCRDKGGWFQFDWTKLGMNDREVTIACAVLTRLHLLAERRGKRKREWKVDLNRLLTHLNEEEPGNTIEALTCYQGPTNVLIGPGERVGSTHESGPLNKNTVPESSLRSSSGTGTIEIEKSLEVHAACGGIVALTGDTFPINSTPFPFAASLASQLVDARNLEGAPESSSQGIPVGQASTSQKSGATSRIGNLENWCIELGISQVELETALAKFLQRPPLPQDLRAYVRGISQFQDKQVSHIHDETQKEITRSFARINCTYLNLAVRQAEFDWLSKGGRHARSITWVIIGTEKVLERRPRSIYLLDGNGEYVYTPGGVHPDEADRRTESVTSRERKPVTRSYFRTLHEAERLITKLQDDWDQKWTLEPPRGRQHVSARTSPKPG